MERYDYREAVKADVLDYIREEIDLHAWDSLEELEEYLNDTLWACDSVTGNASGSYYCNSWKAAEAIAHNWDLLAEAIAEYGGDVDILRQGEEAADVTIRCYCLAQAIAGALEEIADEWGEEDIKMDNNYWYAVMQDDEDSDWGTGSYDLAEAQAMVGKYPDGYIAVIDEGGDPICVEEIR